MEPTAENPVKNLPASIHLHLGYQSTMTSYLPLRSESST